MQWRKFLFGKMKFDWWNTIQACEKLPNVHVMQ